VRGFLATVVRGRLGIALGPRGWYKFKRMDAFKFREQGGAPALWRIGDVVQVLSINGDEIEFGMFKAVRDEA
jgi:allophanate hydrolase subunit 1